MAYETRRQPQRAPQPYQPQPQQTPPSQYPQGPPRQKQYPPRNQQHSSRQGQQQPSARQRPEQAAERYDYPRDNQSYAAWDWDHAGQREGQDYSGPWEDRGQYEQSRQQQGHQDYYHQDQYPQLSLPTHESYNDPGYGGMPPSQSRQQDRRQYAPGSHRPMHGQSPKPRQRILDTLPNPDTIAWDNPFPTWGPGKGKEKDLAKHKSLEQGMDNMNIHDLASAGIGPSPEVRPHTSQGHRRQGGPGPNMYSAPLPPPERPPNFRVDSNQTVRTNRTDQSGHSQQRQDYNQAYDQNSSGLTGPSPPQARPTPKRSNTLPDQNNARQNSSQPRNGINPQAQNGHGYVDPRQLPTSQNASQDSRPLPKGNYGLPSGPRNGQRRPSERQNDSPEMPNFDAIPTTLEDKPHDHLEPLSSPPSESRSAYNKPAYQAFSPPAAETGRPPLNKMKPQPNVKPQTVDQRPGGFADFSFGLSGSDPSSRAQGQQYPQAPTSSNGYPPRSHSRAAGNANNYPPQRIQSPETYQAEPDQYGPSRSFSNTNRPPPQPLAQRSVSDNQAIPTRSASQSNVRNQQYEYGYDNQYGQNTTQQQHYDQGQWANYSQSYSDGYSQSNRQAGVPNRKPPPLHMQNARTESRNAARPDRQMTPTSPTNPDALPAHPVPVRAGLMPQSGAPQTNSRPPPVRQYGAAPVQQQQHVNTSAVASRVSLDKQDAPVTAYDLNVLQQTFKSNPQDYKTGLRLAKKLVEAASVLSNEGGRADAKTAQKNREKYVFDAHKLLKRLVNASYPDAMFYLADCHGTGMLGLEKDPKEAFNLYQSAAKSGHGPSAYRVAVCCELGAEEGGGTRRDPMKALQWYRRAASLGDTPAMYKLGMILLKGLLGQPKNPREALSWLKRAAERADKDNPHALHELGLLYESAAPNDAIIKDENYARELFHQASELGYKYSQFRLGTAYEHGHIGCPIDPKASIMWYTRAAAQAEHQAELALSGWYLTGSADMLPQSDTEAYLWARKSASSGYAKAEYAMGYFTEVGIGAPANLEEAKRWYWRAASQNFPKARERLEELKKGGGKMTKTRISRSQVDKHGDGCMVM